MEAPYTVTITVTDASGKKIQGFEQCELGEKQLVAVQEAVSNAFVGLGKAKLALLDAAAASTKR